MIVEHVELERESLDQIGLREVKMTGLGRFVVLTGKNGAGKSRVLNAVEVRIKQRRTAGKSEAEVNSDLARRRAGLPAESLIDLLEYNSVNLELLARVFRELRHTSAAEPTSIQFVATPCNLTNPIDSSQRECRAAAENIDVNRVTSTRDALKWIWAKYEKYFNLSHPESPQQRQSEALSARQEWDRFKQVVTLLLGQAPTVDELEHQVMLFGRPAHEANLSQGQNILLQLAVALHAHSASLDNTVLFMDEPENHLHPSAVIDVLERLKNASGRMQFWIATHSVPLLAYLHEQDPKCIWYVADGVVQHAGKNQQAVLESLLGNSERLEQLKTFVALPEQVAIEQFAAECLLPPGVSDRGKGDPQVQQIAGVINKLSAERQRPLEVLDYGAGRGRLLAGMQADYTDLAKHISYRALDEFPGGEEDCKRVIESVHGSSEGRYFSDISKLHHDHAAPFDLLVLCNVLHEMTPKDWKRRFGADSNFARLLAPDGFLLVVEDQEIHVGEHAHEYGFLLLDTDELKALFKVAPEDIQEQRFVVSKHSKRGDRLKAHAIAQPLIERVTLDTIKLALNRLQKRSRDTIDKLRATPACEPNAKLRGQAHARAAMLFANASLALEALGST